MNLFKKKEEKEEKLLKKNFSWQIATGVLLVLLIGSIFTNGFGIGQLFLNQADQKIAQKAVDFINSNLLEPGSAADLVEESADCRKNVSLCKFTLDIGGNTYDSYVSSNGEILFPDAVNIKEFEESLNQSQEQEPVEIPKTEKPEVELFVMSYCPFGLQSQKALLPVMDLLKEEADFKMRFVNYIMHDKDEIDENLRQYCIQKQEPEKYIDYLNCFVVDGDFESCLNSTKINKGVIETCVSETDQEYKVSEKYEDESTWLNGLYPLFEVEDDLNKKYSVAGSPTMVINGQVVSPNRTPEDYKNAICQGFEVLPDDCAEELSLDAPVASFGTGVMESSNDATCE